MMQRQTWSLSGLAVELGLDRRTLARYLQDIEPAEEREVAGRRERRWFLSDVFSIAVREASGTRTSPSTFDRLNEIRAQREEILLRRDLGEIVTVAEVRPALRRYFDDILAFLLGIPDQYATQVEQAPGIEGKRQVLEDLVHELRGVLGSYEFGRPVQTSTPRAPDGPPN